MPCLLCKSYSGIIKLALSEQDCICQNFIFPITLQSYAIIQKISLNICAVMQFIVPDTKAHTNMYFLLIKKKKQLTDAEVLSPKLRLLPHV